MCRCGHFVECHKDKRGVCGYVEEVPFNIFTMKDHVIIRCKCEVLQVIPAQISEAIS